MTAESIARELHGRRSGAGYVARCPAHDDHSPSLSLRERDGKVLVHCHTGCSQADVIAALRSRGLWPEREWREWTPTERKQWARERRELERDLPAARYWRRGVLIMLEAVMDAEKEKLFDPTEGPADTYLIRDYTRIISRLEHAEDTMLVNEYREWCGELPEQCAGLVQWAKDREVAEIRAILAYMEMSA
ncbi:MAG: hypothetical protein LAQ30_33010 [Acidobacteriia bacterium]|nr:hypothetical protein [Terriglobia bacterium]